MDDMIDITLIQTCNMRRHLSTMFVLTLAISLLGLVRAQSPIALDVSKNEVTGSRYDESIFRLEFSLIS